mgnify:CR=1 FL=1
MAKTIQVGKKYKLLESVYSSTGLVHKNTVVKAEALDSNKVRVKDHIGRIFWVQPDILISLDDIYSKGE